MPENIFTGFLGSVLVEVDDEGADLAYVNSQHDL